MNLVSYRVLSWHNIPWEQTNSSLFTDTEDLLTASERGLVWGKDCLVCRPHDCARSMRFGSLGPSEPFVSDTSPKCIDRRTRQGKRENRLQTLFLFFALRPRSLALASVLVDFRKKQKTTYVYRLDQQFLLYLTAGFTDLNASQSLVGYLQVSGPKFHGDLCLAEKRNEWLSNFASKHYHYHYYTNLAPKLRHICQWIHRL